MPFDASPALAKLESGSDVTGAWEELWKELHHQGDVGEASYAAIPHFVRIHRQRGVPDWNSYAIVAVIDLARDQPDNPPVPDWLGADYQRAIHDLAETGTTEIKDAKTPEDVRAILSILAIAKGARTHGRFLIEYSADELLDLESNDLSP